MAIYNLAQFGQQKKKKMINELDDPAFGIAKDMVAQRKINETPQVLPQEPVQQQAANAAAPKTGSNTAAGAAKAAGSSTATGMKSISVSGPGARNQMPRNGNDSQTWVDPKYRPKTAVVSPVVSVGQVQAPTPKSGQAPKGVPDQEVDSDRYAQDPTNPNVSRQELLDRTLRQMLQQDEAANLAERERLRTDMDATNRRAVLEARARAGLAGSGLTGAATNIESTVARRGAREAAMTLDEVRRNQDQAMLERQNAAVRAIQEQDRIENDKQRNEINDRRESMVFDMLLWDRETEKNMDIDGDGNVGPPPGVKKGQSQADIDSAKTKNSTEGQEAKNRQLAQGGAPLFYEGSPGYSDMRSKSRDAVETNTDRAFVDYKLVGQTATHWIFVDPKTGAYYYGPVDGKTYGKPLWNKPNYA